MAKSFSASFYKSKQWLSVRAYKLALTNRLCERCLENGVIKPAVDVHHKIILNESNIHDPNITLNIDNLMSVCKECHNIVHGYGPAIRDDLMFDDKGMVIEK